MSTQQHDTPRSAVPARRAETMDNVCDAFELAWLAGQRPKIEDYLDEADQRVRVELVEELLISELRLQIGNGIAPDRDQYIKRFPASEPLIDRIIGQSDRASTSPSHPATTSRSVAAGSGGSLSVRCPHCHNPIDVVVDARLDDIACSSCGSHFSLVQDETTTRDASKITTVGHFELIERLGLGGFGTVWKARDTQLDRTVAVKIPRHGQLGPSDAEKFLREARAIAQLSHPNIVRVYEVGRDGDSVYIVSDLIRGVSLADRLTAGRLTARESAQLCAKIADALSHAHEAGVVHRDLKPQNIMVDADGDPILMDFGLARRDVGEVTVTIDGQLLGTPAYMSPEQARGDAHNADHRTDLYSLGVILFELLTDERPFRGSARMIVHQVMTEEAPSPRKLNASLPRDLETICLKCLEKDPRKRYETAGDVAGEFHRFLAQKPIKARRVTPVERAWRWCLRNRLVSALAATVAFSLTLGTVLASWQAIVANQHRQVAERHHYQALTNLIQLDWEKNDIGRVRTSVKDAGAYAIRGFEYLYWQRQLHRNRKTFYGHLDRVADIALSPDGRLLATASNDGTVKVWDIATGSVLRTLRGHTSWVRSVNFFPDGKRIVTSSDDLTTRVWDIESGRECLILRGHTACRMFSTLSPDGRRIVTTSYDGVVKIWDSTSGDVLHTRNLDHEIWGVAISPDGKRIAIGKESHREQWGTARLLDLDDETVSIDLNHAGKIWTFEFSPNGKWIVTASGDGTAGIWDADTGEKVVTILAHISGVTSVGFSRNNERIVTGGRDGTIKVWDWNGQTAKEKIRLAGHQHFVWSTVFLPDNRTLVTGSSDGTAKLWDITAPEPRVLHHPLGALCVAFAQDDQIVVSGCDDGMLRFWNGTTGKLERSLPAHNGYGVTSLAVDPSGDWIVSGSEDGTAKVWSLATGQLRFERPLLHDAAVTTVCVSNDGKWIATGSRDRTVKLWATATGMLTRTLTNASWVKSLVIAPDNRQLFASGDPTTVCYDVHGGGKKYELPWPGPYYPEECLAISDELLVVGGLDEWQRPKADVWNWADGDGEPQVTLRGHSRSFLYGDFSPDGQRIVTASMDGTAKVWDTSTGRELLTLTGHTDQVKCAVFSADGLRIATASLDGTVRIWSAASPSEAARWQQQDEAADRYLAELKREQLAADQRQVAHLRQDAGAIRQWLILGPIKLTTEQTDTALDVRLIPEARINPVPEQPISVADQMMYWRSLSLKDYQLDFSSTLGPGVGKALAYAVCYVESDAARQGVRIIAGNRGLAKIYWNGLEIYKRTVDAAHPFGHDTIPNLRLESGRNVIVCKYVQVGGSWPGSLRITDKDGDPLTGIRIHSGSY